MKKFLYLIPTFFLLFSCSEEAIDHIPYNAVNQETVLQFPKDFNNFILGGYSYMVKNGGADGFGQELLIDTECSTDNLILNPQGRQSNKDGYNWTNTANSSSFSFYNSAYRSALMANIVIDQINKLDPGTFRDNILGEAYFIRAINYFELLRNYSKIPTQSSDANSSLGIAYITSSKTIIREPRTSVADCYSKLLSDLNNAAGLIGNSSTVVGSGRANKASVYGLLSRVHLYMGNYASCITNADLAIAASGATVTSRANFYTSANVGLWEDTAASSTGVLFKLRLDIVDAVNPGVAYSQAVGSAIRSEYVVSKELFDIYQATDIRKAAYFKTGVFSGNSYNNIGKYDGRATGQRNLVDVKLIRIEEVILNKAEAEYKLTGGGLASLDLIRSNRYSSFVSGGETGTALWNAIQLERRLEMAFEMDRYYTLKRLSLPLVRSSVDGHFSNGTGTPAVVTNIAANDFRWQFPIPQDEIDINPAIVQNPGYN